jgi:SAM-dependent methyltransferase
MTAVAELPRADVRLDANAARFGGFADLYDDVRPSPPAALGELITRYCGGRPGLAVDLGSGTGLSTAWAATWAERVVGVEPSAGMRTVAAARRTSERVTFVEGWAHDSGLHGESADAVVAVQAMHWMEPTATLAEVARLLRPGGVFAVVDCDWPPSVGDAEAEAAWEDCRRRFRVIETRLADGVAPAAAGAPVAADDPAAADYSGRDTHHRRRMVAGVRSWSKDAHLAEMVRSGRFRWCRELALHHVQEGTGRRFVDVLRSQGDYQTLRERGFDDDVLGLNALSEVAQRRLGDEPGPWWFTYRVRLGFR